MRAKRALLVVAPAILALLSACHSSQGARPDDQRTAAGQVLSGSVSDAMIPYDALSSTAPAAAPHARAGDANAADQPDGSDTAAPDATQNAAQKTSGTPAAAAPNPPAADAPPPQTSG